MSYRAGAKSDTVYVAHYDSESMDKDRYLNKHKGLPVSSAINHSIYLIKHSLRHQLVPEQVPEADLNTIN